MNDANCKQFDDCQSEEVAAYLDGEMNAQTAALFEEHLAVCARCAGLLQEQRRLLCALDFALGDRGGQDIQLPTNFSRVVATQAQSDLRGLRTERAERRCALRLCLALACASFLLLGSAALSESVFKPVALLFRHAGTVLGFVARALYDVGAGVAVLLRSFGGHAIFESYSLAALVLLSLAVSAVLLPRLISSYHRTHIALEEAAPRR